MNRREFLRTASLVGGAALVGGPNLLGLRDSASAASGAVSLGTPLVPADSVLNSPATECPIDTIVVLMMENRSFDHYFGFLGTDEQYLEEGRSRHGKDFSIDGRIDLTYTDEEGKKVKTRHVSTLGNEPNPFRGCLHKDPGHGWAPCRAQRDHGFLGAGTGNDEFATSYYLGDDIPVQTSLARRFTVMDKHHCSVLGPTWPNRQYLYSAQSEGRKTSPKPLDIGQYHAPTIFEKLSNVRVTSAEYFVNIPPVLLWGSRLLPHVRSMDRFYADAQDGTLPNVTFLTPGMGTPYRTDDHPTGDISLGQRFMHSVLSTFARSPQWERGMFVLLYDEHGGFFDHVKPPIVPDARASKRDSNNFGQLGFRVPSVLASPYAPRNYVDHNLYDHTSILRFLEWRFLGAPPQGPGGDGDKWFLTTRDRHANNFGASLRSADPDPEVDLETPHEAIPMTTGDCDHGKKAGQAGKDDQSKTFEVSDQLEALSHQQEAQFNPWLRETGIRDLPVEPDDHPR